MTALTPTPDYLPRLVTNAMKLRHGVRVIHYAAHRTTDNHPAVFLEISWSDGSTSHHTWQQHPNGVWEHVGKQSISGTRERIRKELDR